MDMEANDRWKLKAYRYFLEAMAEGALISKPEGSIVYCNRQFAQMVKAPAENVTLSSILHFIEPSATDGMRLLLSRLADPDPGSSGARVQMDLLASDGTIMPAYISMHPLRMEDHCAIGMVVMEMSALGQAQEQLVENMAQLKQKNWELSNNLDELQTAMSALLLQSNELGKARRDVQLHQGRYAELFEYAPDGYVVTDHQGVMREINRAAAILLGIDRDLAVGKPLIIFVMEEDRKEFHFHLNRLNELEGIQSWEMTIKPYGGLPFPAEMSISAMRSPVTNEITLRWLIRDITQRKKVEAANLESQRQMRLLSSRLISAQEEERRRISGELHDSIGSSLSAIKYSLEGAIIEMERGTATPRMLTVLVDIAQHAIEESRRIMMELRPSMLDDLGITATLRWFCRQFGTVYTGITIRVEIEVVEEEVPEQLKIVIFRIVQEAFHNTAKHSRASLVHLSLKRRNGMIGLLIADNGQGFDPQSVSSPDSNGCRGLGLSSMRERAEFTGGSFTMESEIGKGTRVHIRWTV